MKQHLLRVFFISLLIHSSFTSFAQVAVISGIVKDSTGKPVEAVSVSVAGEAGGTTSDIRGRYELRVTPYRDLKIVFSSLGFTPVTYSIRCNPGEQKSIDVTMRSSTTVLGPVDVRGEKSGDITTIRIEPKTLEMMPSVSGNFEGVLKTFPGVVSNNELTSSYSVRGGNFDENLVYVNDIEIYRPFLTRTGQQEGLSFINSDLVSNIQFSSGGFGAMYGDKLSSVLDIRYRRPEKFGGSAYFSLLGAGFNLEGTSKNRKFTWLTGFRQKSNQFLLQNLDTKGEYKPSFTDLQALVTYKVSPRSEFSVLGNYSRNQYQVFPATRSTEFGNINEALRFTVFFDGQEKDQYRTSQGAVSFTSQLTDSVRIRFTASAFYTREQEFFDILGQYEIGELERDLGSEQFGDVAFNRGIGAFLDHARNELDALVTSAEHRGYITKEKFVFLWGLKAQHEEINDKIDEWQYRDSADYSIPHGGDYPGDTTHQFYTQQIVLNNVIRNDINLSSNRFSGFIQNTWNLNRFSITAGVRTTYWDLNSDLNISPRASIAWNPEWRRRLSFRIATGYYYQPPFYRELRNLEGQINRDVVAQRSIHLVAGADYQFLAWGREFKLTSEAYYKKMDNLIPYKVDNTRLRYLAQNNATGYATGLDFRLNGEFVSGIESWASLSLLKTEEDINNDQYYNYYNSEGKLILPGYTRNDIPVDSVLITPGNIPRPSDQHVTFSMFFQDYLPKFPSCRMHLNLVFGTGLPFGPPGNERYKDILRGPTYRRVDLGFSKILIDEDKANTSRLPVIRTFHSMWISLEVFNLLQVSNTVSYTWITDVTGRQYGIPNYLTSRLLNFRVQAKF